MILINLNKLTQALRDDSVPQKHFFNYFLIYLVLTSLSGLSFQAIAGEELWLDNIEIIITTIIGAGFTIHFYNLCQDVGKASKFFEYYFSIGFVFTLRFVVFSLFLAIPIGLIIGIITWNLPEELITEIEDYAYLVVTPIVMIIYFLLFLKWFKRVLEPTID